MNDVILLKQFRLSQMKIQQFGSIQQVMVLQNSLFKSIIINMHIGDKSGTAQVGVPLKFQTNQVS